MKAEDPFWDITWNPFAGCSRITPGCLNCYAMGNVPLLIVGGATLYEGLIDWEWGEPVWNGKMAAYPPGDWHWSIPLTYAGARNPVMGPGRRSIILCSSMADLFHEARPPEIYDRVVETLTVSGHIGMLLNKRTAVKAKYLLADGRWSPRMLRLMQESLWLGFSAENQYWFDRRWADMRALAERDWFVFAVVNPMLGPVRPPDDFLAYGERTWVVNEGEDCGKHCRWMDPAWARALRDQCLEAGIPYFFRQMAGEGPIPRDLLICRDFPRRL
jgi:protein gp37